MQYYLSVKIWPISYFLSFHLLFKFHFSFIVEILMGGSILRRLILTPNHLLLVLVLPGECFCQSVSSPKMLILPSPCLKNSTCALSPLSAVRPVNCPVNFPACHWGPSVWDSMTPSDPIWPFLTSSLPDCLPSLPTPETLENDLPGTQSFPIVFYSSTPILVP